MKAKKGSITNEDECQEESDMKDKIQEMEDELVELFAEKEKPENTRCLTVIAAYHNKARDLHKLKIMKPNHKSWEKQSSLQLKIPLPGLFAVDWEFRL